jgi:protein-disulfide isomerase
MSSVTRDTLAGRELGIRATPTFLINERKFQGAPPLAILEKYIRDAARTRRGTKPDAY